MLHKINTIHNHPLISPILDPSNKTNPLKNPSHLNYLINLKHNLFLNLIKDHNSNSNLIPPEILLKLLIFIVKIKALDSKEACPFNNKINKIPDSKNLNIYSLKLNLIISMLSIETYNSPLIKKIKEILSSKIKINSNNLLEI